VADLPDQGSSTAAVCRRRVVHLYLHTPGLAARLQQQQSMMEWFMRVVQQLLWWMELRTFVRPALAATAACACKAQVAAAGCWAANVCSSGSGVEREAQHADAATTTSSSSILGGGVV
jgi:hypothetical protein